MAFVDAFTIQLQRSNRGSGGLVRGVVGAVHRTQSGQPMLFTVNGVPMPSLVMDLVVGEHVAFFDQADPIIVGRLAMPTGGTVPPVVPPDPGILPPFQLPGIEDDPFDFMRPRPQRSAPTIPGFDQGNAVTIDPTQDFAAVVAGLSPGSHVRVLAGEHRPANVRVKNEMHIRMDPGVLINGQGRQHEYFIVPDEAGEEGNRSMNVTIGGLRSTDGQRVEIVNWQPVEATGRDLSRFAPIMATTDDVLAVLPNGPVNRGEQFFPYRATLDWLVYGLDLRANAPHGVFLGHRTTVFDCEMDSNAVNGVHGNRGIGGLLKDCRFLNNGLSGASGALADAGQVKLVWHNGSDWRQGDGDALRAVGGRLGEPDLLIEPLFVSTCYFKGGNEGDPANQSPHGVWGDLDCKLIVVEHSIFEDHRNSSIHFEGCNANEGGWNVVRRCDGHEDQGNQNNRGLNSNLNNAALSAGESTRTNFHHNLLEDCERAMVNRLANRTNDWLNPDSSANAFNYAVARGLGSSRVEAWLHTEQDIPQIPQTTELYPTDRATIGQSNIWTGANQFTANHLRRCGRVAITEGTNTTNPAQTTHGATPLDTIDFDDNNYDESPGIDFYAASNTRLSLAQWQALGRQ